MADTDTFDDRFDAATAPNKRLSDDDIDYLFGKPAGPIKNPVPDIAHPSIPGIRSVESSGGDSGGRFPSGLWGGVGDAVGNNGLGDWWKRATTPYKVPPMPDVSGPGDIYRDLTTGRNNPVENANPTPDRGHLSAAPTRADGPVNEPPPPGAPPFGAGAVPPVGGVAGGLTPGGPTFPTFQRPPLPPAAAPPGPAPGAAPPPAAQPSPAPGATPGAAPGIGATPGGSPQVPPKDTSLLPPGSLADIMHKWTSWRDENRLMLLAMAGGLAGSQSIGQGLGRAFSAAVPAAQADMARGNANATADLLMQKIPNLTRDQAVAMARNPEIMKQVIPQLYGEQRQHVTYKDSDGVEHLASFDPRTGQYFDSQGRVMGGAGGGQAPAGSPDYNLTGEEFLKTVTDPAKANLIRKAAAGELQLSPRQLATPGGMAFAKQVTAYDPSWVPQEAQNRQKAFGYWYGGGTGDKTVKALDQAADHMSGLPDLIEGVPRGGGILDNPLINEPYNYARYKGGYTNNQPLYTRAHAVADELSSLWKGTSTDHEIQAWSKSFPVNGSKAQQKQAVAELIHLVNGGINSLHQQHERDFGSASARMNAERPVVSAQTAAKLEALRKYANEEGPAGGSEARPAELPRITSKAEFDALPKGAHFLDEHGKPWVK